MVISDVWRHLLEASIQMFVVASAPPALYLAANNHPELFVALIVVGAATSILLLRRARQEGVQSPVLPGHSSDFWEMTRPRIVRARLEHAGLPARVARLYTAWHALAWVATIVGVVVFFRI